MRDTGDSSHKTVRAVARALDILEALGQTEEGIGLVDLASAVNLTHPTAYRLLKTMESKGFVAQDTGSSRYYLSKKILQMQATNATERRLIQLAVPKLTELAEQLGGAGSVWCERGALHLHSNARPISTAWDRCCGGPGCHPGMADRPGGRVPRGFLGH